MNGEQEDSLSILGQVQAGISFFFSISDLSWIDFFFFLQSESKKPHEICNKSVWTWFQVLLKHTFPDMRLIGSASCWCPLLPSPALWDQDMFFSDVPSLKQAHVGVQAELEAVRLLTGHTRGETSTSSLNCCCFVACVCRDVFRCGWQTWQLTQQQDSVELLFIL